MIMYTQQGRKNMHSIRIDHRETELIRIFKDLDVVHNITSLDQGDVQLVCNDEIEIVMERKTFPDVLSSIHDGRWTEQKIRAMSCLSNARLLYLIELGDEIWDARDALTTSKGFKNFSSVSYESGMNAIMNLYIVYNIPFLFVRNTDMTADMILSMYRQLSKKKDGHDFKASYEKSFIKSISGVQSRRKDNVDGSMYYLYCLTGIPSISHKTATQIKELFPTLHCLVSFLKDNPESELQKLWKTKYSRKLNNKATAFMYQVFAAPESTEDVESGESPRALGSL